MSKKILTIQDISCYGSCSITVALPILAAYGIETAILPSAILSTHTSGFKDFIVHDLTDEMPNIINHWINEKIQFDAIYTGYIGDVRQFNYILEFKEKLLKPNGLFIVDPAMADNGKLYSALNDDIINGMKEICSVADYILPNITEACFLTNKIYQEKMDDSFINGLLVDLVNLGSKNVILTGVIEDDTIGAIAYDGITKTTILKEKIERSYHGTGDIFSSIIVADILNGKNMKDTLNHATDFVIDSILATIDDPEHNYGVKFENILKKQRQDL